MMGWMEELVERRLRGQEVLCGGVLFEVRGFWNKADDKYSRFLPHSNLKRGFRQIT